MRREIRLAAAVATSALALAGPVASAGARTSATAKPVIDGSVTKSFVVPTRDGEIYVEADLPTSHGTVVRAPAILTYSPYSILGRNGDASHWNPLGYDRIYADVIGTGNSGGCWDYGGPREQRSGYDVVEWIAHQPWSTGKVGMLGVSYDGTTQYAIAVNHPPHLTTIVPEAAIARWYDYAYSGGIRYTDTNEDLGNEGPGVATDEGIDTPAAFDYGLAIPAPADPNDPDWAGRVTSKIRPCDELAHTSYGYSLTPDYDGFWRDRDYASRLSTVRIPVLVAANWGDWNVKQIESWDAYHALLGHTFVRLYMGTRWMGHGTPPGAAYQSTVDAWMAHFLQGASNNVTSSAPVTSETSDDAAPIRYISGPEPSTSAVNLYLGHGASDWTLGTSPAKAPAGAPAATFTWTGTNTESFAAAHPFLGGGYLAFETAPLTHDVRLFGEPVLHLYSTQARQWVTITPSLLDDNPSNHAGTGAGTVVTSPSAVVAITRGWLDSRYRDGLDHEELATPGAPLATTVVLKPTDYTVRAGHRLVLLVSTETAEWAIPKAYPVPSDPTVRIDYESAQSRLTVPIVGSVANPAGLFAAPAASAAPAALPAVP